MQVCLLSESFPCHHRLLAFFCLSPDICLSSVWQKIDDSRSSCILLQYHTVFFTPDEVSSLSLSKGCGHRKVSIPHTGPARLPSYKLWNIITAHYTSFLLQLRTSHGRCDGNGALGLLLRLESCKGGLCWTVRSLRHCKVQFLGQTEWVREQARDYVRA